MKTAALLLAIFLALAGLPASGLCAPSHDACGAPSLIIPELCCCSAEDPAPTLSSTLPAKPVFVAQGAFFQSPAHRVTTLSLSAGRHIAPSAEPPPPAPFYRTTFANHAPPAFLA